MSLKLIIVEPKYQVNLGYIARVAKNFGVRRLFFVNPRVKLNGKTTTMYAKHAHGLLETSRVYGDFDSAVRDCDIVVGTTGIWMKARSDFRRVYLPDQLVRKLKRIANEKSRIALVIGRDDIGLTKEELEKCDLITYIGTDPEYPVLNISHALGIMLFVLTKSGFDAEYREVLAEKPEKKELEALLSMVDRTIAKRKIRKKEAVKRTFRRVLALSQPTRHEVHALMMIFK
jgi:tRNA/rRNA methyltransferase